MVTAPTVERVVAWWAGLRRPAAGSTPGTWGQSFPLGAGLRRSGVNVTDPAPQLAGIGSKAASPASNQRQNGNVSILDTVFPLDQCVHDPDRHGPVYTEAWNR